MKIYTKTGDRGETQIYAGEMIRKSKSDVIVDCYGTLDELNAQVGLLHTTLADIDNVDGHKIIQQTIAINKTSTTVATWLQTIQKDIFALGFAISNSSQIRSEAVDELESTIDFLEKTLPKQTRFILPGGSLAAAQAHVCRTIARRSERCLVALREEHDVDPLALAYINRLSDALFVFARWLNQACSIEDVQV